MSENHGWLDTATLPALAWWFSARYYEPDMLLNENVGNFDHTEMTDIMQDNSEGTLKSPYARPPHPSGKPNHYEIYMEHFSIEDLGIPTKRARNYTAFRLSPWVKTVVQVSFETLFFRNLVASGAMFLRAVPETIKDAEIAHTLQDRGEELAKARGNLSMEALSPGDFGRMQAAEILAKKENLLDASGKCELPMLLFNVTQRPEYWGKFDLVTFPTLLTKSTFWDFSEQELVPVVSHWLSMGFAHPLVDDVPQDLKGDNPIHPDLLQLPHGLPLMKQRVLTGNAMHWAAISCWETYQLVTTETLAPIDDGNREIP